MPNAKPIPRVSIPTEVDVFAIRSTLGLTQQNFAHAYGLVLGTVRDWEQGRTFPDAAARAYLLAIANDPKAVRAALQGQPTRT